MKKEKRRKERKKEEIKEARKEGRKVLGKFWLFLCNLFSFFFFF
jgi:hypothetical protein